MPIWRMLFYKNRNRDVEPSPIGGPGASLYAQYIMNFGNTQIFAEPGAFSELLFTLQAALYEKARDEQQRDHRRREQRVDDDR